MPMITGKPRQPPSYQRSSDWRPATITVVWVNDGGYSRPRKFSGQVYGGVAVHPSERHDKPWAVTHVNSGLRLCQLSSEQTCYRIAEHLWDHCCLALRLKEGEAVRAKLPPWVIPWLKACMAADDWVNKGRG